MNLIPAQELTPDQWKQLYDHSYDKETLETSGSQVAYESIRDKIMFPVFVKKITDEVAKGSMVMVAVVDKEEKVIGSGQLLLSNHGEYELGVTLYKENRNYGYGPRVAMYLIKYAFDNGVPWVVAFSYGKEDSVRQMLIRLGFKKLMNFWVLENPTPDDHEEQ